MFENIEKAAKAFTAMGLLGIADSTIKRLLKEMVDENILVAEGDRKTRKYLLKVEV